MEKIAVAVSGGVDSLVGTCLLKAAGHTIKGFHFITGFEFNKQENLSKIKDLYDNLGVELEILDFSETFKTNVVNYFAGAYAAGLTPNPCMVCNPSVKFGLLLKHVLGQGFNKLATGHYAKIEDIDGAPALFKGLDPLKDQAYFLAMLSPSQLGQVVFPLGGYLKAQVKAMASEFGVKPIHKDESQDICFIRGDYTSFLHNRLGFKNKKGPVVRQNGEVIGSHNGLHYFTVGQRRGINIPAPKPYYVLALKPQANTLVVGFAEELGTTKFFVQNPNWLTAAPHAPFNCTVKVRYRSPESPCTVTPLGNDKLAVKLNQPLDAVSPGQGAVFYHNNRVLGGGFITLT